jgi:hypothetical protein
VGVQVPLRAPQQFRPMRSGAAFSRSFRLHRSGGLLQLRFRESLDVAGNTTSSCPCWAGASGRTGPRDGVETVAPRSSGSHVGQGSCAAKDDDLVPKSSQPDDTSPHRRWVRAPAQSFYLIRARRPGVSTVRQSSPGRGIGERIPGDLVYSLGVMPRARILRYRLERSRPRVSAARETLPWHSSSFFRM